ncbi:MAG: hypothetical protein WCK73_08020 [Deltaproteobacteria bacterium]
MSQYDHLTAPRGSGSSSSLVWAAAFALLCGCGPGEPAPPPRPPEVSLEDVQARAWRGADLAASGTADRVVYRRDTGSVTATNAHVDIPRPVPPDLSLSAPTLAGDLRSRVWKGEGGVVLTRGDAVARTPSARFAESDGMVRGDEPVEIVGPGYRMSGPAFTADPRTGDLRIRGGVRLRADGKAP